MRTFRSLSPPLITILVLSGMTGCDREAERQRKEELHRQMAEEQRRESESQPPPEAVLNQVRSAAEAFLAEHHADLAVESSTFTPLTPNLFLVGVSVQEKARGNRYVKQLTAERLREKDDPDSRHIWVIDYLDPAKMRVLAERHGLAPEVDAIEMQDLSHPRAFSWGHSSWIDHYLLWHFLFARPNPLGYWPGQGFRPMAPGFRFHDPERPLRPEDTESFRNAGMAAGGRSRVFLGGSAWRPPIASGVVHGQGFYPRGSGISGKTSMGGVSRGGFGHAGHAAGTHGG